MGGIYSGLFTGILPIFLNEIAPPNLRGTTGTVQQLFCVIGILISNILGLPEILGTAELWPVLLGLILVPGLGNFCLFFFEESPKFLYKKNKKEAAEKGILILNQLI